MRRTVASQPFELMSKGFHVFTLSAIGFLILALSVSAQSIKQYSLIDLGILQRLGDDVSSGSALNNLGQVVGRSSGGDSQYFFGAYAFEYANGTITDLGGLGDPNYVDPNSSASDINDSGQVVGFSAISAYYYHAFLYTDGTMFDLGAVGLLAGHESLAYGINSSGEVVGYYGDNLNANIGAFLYSGGAVQDIGSFGGDRTWAFGINDSGQVVGFSQTADERAHAFLYENGTMLDLGAIGLLAGHDSIAYGINNAGDVVGSYEASVGNSHAFLLSEGAVLDLGTVGPLNGNTSYANSINSSGQVVGHYTTSDNVGHSFFYSGGAAYTLDNLVAPGAGWTGLSANDINDLGQITGSGTHNGAVRAFLATPGDISVPPAPSLLNISTRLEVLNGDNVLIGGFIITGSDAKKVILRGLGPSLAGAGVAGYLPDPFLELHDQTGTIAADEDWKDTQESEIEASGIAPADDKEAAIVATLSPGAYTVILRQSNGGAGIGLVEAYDLDQAANSTMANISTRGFVDTGDNVMIGGFISGSSLNGGGTVLVRAIGPSLADSGLSSAVQDPTLELHDSNGAVLEANDNWMDTQATEIMATGLAPTDERESAVLTELAGSAYTVIVRGANNTTGVALVEVYNLQ